MKSTRGGVGRVPTNELALTKIYYISSCMFNKSKTMRKRQLKNVKIGKLIFELIIFGISWAAGLFCLVCWLEQGLARHFDWVALGQLSYCDQSSIS
jgi:hypothetical protein